MSWIGGSLIMKDLSKKELENAYSEIRSMVRHNADLEEFPNMGSALLKIKELMHGHVFDSYRDAENYLDNNSSWRRRYHACVAFRDLSGVKKTKAREALEKRLQDTMNLCASYEKDHSINNFKAQYVSCTGCGSKINKIYIKRDRCPLCGQDLRSDTVKNTIARYKNKCKDLESQIRKEEQKNASKAAIHYLLNYEEYIG